MKCRTRRYFTESDKALMWDRWGPILPTENSELNSFVIDSDRCAISIRYRPMLKENFLNRSRHQPRLLQPVLLENRDSRD